MVMLMRAGRVALGSDKEHIHGSRVLGNVTTADISRSNVIAIRSVKSVEYLRKNEQEYRLTKELHALACRAKFYCLPQPPNFVRKNSATQLVPNFFVRVTVKARHWVLGIGLRATAARLRARFATQIRVNKAPLISIARPLRSTRPFTTLQPLPIPWLLPSAAFSLGLRRRLVADAFSRGRGPAAGNFFKAPFQAACHVVHGRGERRLVELVLIHRLLREQLQRHGCALCRCRGDVEARALERVRQPNWRNFAQLRDACALTICSPVR
eukprot:2954553-Pleurochrysis_carterae.AAC.2